MATMIIEAPRPEDDKHWFEDEGLPLRFRECDACRTKPGSPVLCAGCLSNRMVIGRLLVQTREQPPEPLRQACLALLGEAHVHRDETMPQVVLERHLQEIYRILRDE